MIGRHTYTLIFSAAFLKVQKLDAEVQKFQPNAFNQMEIFMPFWILVIPVQMQGIPLHISLCAFHGCQHNNIY